MNDKEVAEESIKAVTPSGVVEQTDSMTIIRRKEQAELQEKEHQRRLERYYKSYPKNTVFNEPERIAREQEQFSRRNKEVTKYGFLMPDERWYALKNKCVDCGQDVHYIDQSTNLNHLDKYDSINIPWTITRPNRILKTEKVHICSEMRNNHQILEYIIEQLHGLKEQLQRDREQRANYYGVAS